MADRNLISGGSLPSIWIAGTGNRIVGNFIGVNRAATAAISNSVEVIKFWGGQEHIVEYKFIGGSSDSFDNQKVSHLIAKNSSYS